MRIRSKLLILMAIPTLVVLLVAGLGFRSQTNAAADVAAARSSIEQATLTHRAFEAITIERLAHIGATDMAGAEEIHGATDESLDMLAEFGTASGRTEITNSVNLARGQIELGRSSTDRIEGIELYSNAYAALSEIPSDLIATLQSGEELIHSLATDLVVTGTEEQSTAWFLYLSAIDPAEADLTNISLAFALSHQSFAHAAEFDTELGSTNLSSMSALRVLETIALDDLAEGQLSLSAEEILPELLAFTQDWSSVVADQDAEAIAIADAAQGRATTTTILFVVALLAALLLAWIVYSVYRSIANPLDHLVDRAHRVASDELPSLVESLRETDGGDELPTPTLIQQDTSDELGELVEAFNGMQSTAYQLAIEQSIGKRNVSDTFVNFGRRNQLLLQRMLTVITGLELDEEDPDSLKGLFELDNIVTRMRRNAESLLILAGAQTTRQWTSPVAITDTVRAAFGEVEGYERIDIVALADVKLRGSAVSDVSHLLAELLENALNFSEKSTPVLVSGRFDKTGYLISIFDQGIGMTVEELDEANQRIWNPPALDLAPTRFLGLFVVGRLADRHGISARLVEAPGRGLMARVHLPRELLVVEESNGQEPENLATSTSSKDTDQQTTETSPLETEIDIDTEWAELSQEELPQRQPTSVEETPAEELPQRQPTSVEETPAEEPASLPTRQRGESLSQAATPVVYPTDPARDPSVSTGPQPAESVGNADSFSSMMTALSSGISRGLEDSSDDEWSGK